MRKTFFAISLSACDAFRRHLVIQNMCLNPGCLQFAHPGGLMRGGYAGLARAEIVSARGRGAVPQRRNHLSDCARQRTGEGHS